MMVRTEPHESALERVASAIADGAAVDWTEFECGAEYDGLQLLDDVARAFRDSGDGAAAPRAAPVLFRWGPLEIHARLGEGSYGEVYRAWDPWLRREVALKLMRGEVRSGDMLDEARRLAQVRQRNVLSVFGCAIHDGRAGMWSELVEGATLSGPLAQDEVRRIGRDLARALVAVHAAGLVHGDVKAENVIRAADGRIVLMDFGAGGEERLLASRRVISGTPRYLAPEVLDGAPQTRASDIYALGVLLQTLRDERQPRDAVLQRCLAADPAQRPSAGALLALLQPAAPRPGSRLAVVLGALALAAVLALVAWPYAFPPRWRAISEFVRLGANGTEPLGATATVAVGDRLRLRLSSNRDAYYYVLNEDADHVATVLYPLAAAAPLRAGAALELPAPELAWQVTAGSAREEFLVVAALTPLPELDAALNDWQRAQAATRAVGAVVGADPPTIRGARLSRVREQLAARTDASVWYYAFDHAR